MKKFIVSLVAAAFASITVSAEAGSAPTNVIDVVNVQLEFTSVTATNTNYVTNIVTHETSKTNYSVTNIVTNIVYVSVTTPVTTSDLIDDLTTNTAPRGSTLDRVRETNGDSYIAVRHKGTNVLVVDGDVTLSSSLTVPLPTRPPFHEKLTSTENTVTGKADELISFGFTTPAVSCSAKGEGTRVWTGDSFTIGTITLQYITESLTVAGTGTDSSGSDEIVTGTVTVGGDTLGD